MFPSIPDKYLAGATQYKCKATRQRDKRLPRFYVAKDHPQRPEELRGLGRDFVYGWHSRDATFVSTYRRIAAKEWGVELGPNATMDDKGACSDALICVTHLVDFVSRRL